MEKNLTGFASIDKPWEIHYPENYEQIVLKDIKSKMVDFMEAKNEDNHSEIAIDYLGLGVDISYQELFKKIDEYAKILYGYGIREGDIVSLVMPNVPETIYIKYALNKIGAVANMIEPRHSCETILSHINNSHSKLVFTVLDACEKKIDPIIDKINADDIVVVSVSDSFKWSDGIIPSIINLKYYFKTQEMRKKDQLSSKSKYTLLRDFFKWSDGVSYDVSAPFKENAPATIVYTSGTTGTSKGAVLTNEAYNTMHNQIKMVGDWRKGDTFFGAIPFFSAYGSFCGMHNSLCCTQKIILLPKFNPNKAAETILKYKPNVSFLVPDYWNQLAKCKKAQHKNLSYLHIIVAGGDVMYASQIERINDFLQKHNCTHPVRVGYGASEFGGAVSVVPEGKYYVPGSSGIVLPSCNCMIIDPDTEEELTYGNPGEVCFSTPTMMLGYLDKESETEELIVYKNGLKYYRTGDKGYIDENGVLYVIGRYKRSLMRPDGHTVHATPIENKIIDSPLVEACCVVGLPLEGKSGVIPTAFVVLKDKENIEENIKKIDEFCLQSLSERERALAYVVIDEIPYNLMGKIDYTKLENLKINDLDLIVVDDTFFKKDNTLTRIKKI